MNSNVNRLSSMVAQDNLIFQSLNRAIIAIVILVKSLLRSSSSGECSDIVIKNYEEENQLVRKANAICLITFASMC